MQRFVPPLFDRLMDRFPNSGSESLKHVLTVGQLKDAVSRDLELLLNTRRGSTCESLAGYPNARGSVVAFGLDDFSSKSLASPVDRTEICRSIERAISDHEPRLKHVRVELSKRNSTTQRVRFMIHATLFVHPLQDSVDFEAMLQTTTQHYQVHIGGRAV